MEYNVPTDISYREGNTSEFTWGYGIDPQAPRVKGINLLLGTDDADSRAFLPLGHLRDNGLPVELVPARHSYAVGARPVPDAGIKSRFRHDCARRLVGC